MRYTRNFTLSVLLLIAILIIAIARKSDLNSSGEDKARAAREAAEYADSLANIATKEALLISTQVTADSIICCCCNSKIK